MSKNALKVALAILGLVPTVTGVLAMMGIHDPLLVRLNLPSDPLLDSNLRFFGGVWLGLGLTVLFTVRHAERYLMLYRVIWLMIFIGGIGRLLSIALIGWPPIPFIAFTALEVIGAPLFVLWHQRVAEGVA